MAAPRFSRITQSVILGKKCKSEIRIVQMGFLEEAACFDARALGQSHEAVAETMIRIRLEKTIPSFRSFSE
jgi:hypothetical protein